MTTQSYKGKVVGKSILLEEGVELPEGATVEVRLVSEHAPPSSEAEKESALQRLLSMNLPVGDWEQMEEEIARGAMES